MIHLKEYRIGSGSHGRLHLPCFTTSNSISFEVAFTESCKYDLFDNDQLDINKLFGLSDCWSYHHRHSARIGWRWSEDIDRFEVFAYWYNHKIWHGFQFELIAELLPYENQKFKIVLDSYKYRFYVGDTDILNVPRSKGCKHGLKYMLFPYFGGNETAPHDMTILYELNV